ncbi:MAG: hypothetical protein AB8H86_32650, partial [Polyangiales bacterium]
AERAWLFRWAVDGSAKGAANGNCYRGTSSVVHIHEIGHMLGLGHGGPNGTSAEFENGANRRPNYASRMNYRFQNVQSNSFAFSSASVEGAVSSRGADENDPFGATPSATVAALREGDPTVHVWDNLPNGQFNEDVDWNFNGAIDPVPTIWAEYRNEENGRNARESAGRSHNDPDLDTSIYGSHMDAAISGDALVLAYVDYHGDAGWPGTAFYTINSDGRCDTVPSESGGSWSYGPCMELGYAFPLSVGDVDAVSMAPTLLPAQSGGGTVPGLVFVYRNGTTLGWKTMDIALGGPPLAQQASGTLSGSVRWDTQVDVTLVEVPLSASNPHGGVLMIYQDSGSVLRQRFLPAGTTSWSVPSQVTTSLSSGTHYSYGDVGAVAHGDKVYLAARHSSVSSINIYSVPAGAGAGTTWTFETTVPSTQGIGTDIELAVAPAPPGQSEPELFVVYRDNDNVLLETRTVLPGFGSWTTPDSTALETGERSESGVALVYDDRAVASSAPGLRAYRNLHRRCDGPPGQGVSSACDTPGYAPGRPADLTCTGTYCESFALDFTGAPRPSHISQSPFSEGHHPTLYCDYNDYVQIRWSTCQKLAEGRDAPSGTSDFVVTPYDSEIRCGLRPVHPEPQSNGTCGPLASTNVSEMDRINNPAAYIPSEEEVTCAE